MRVLVTGGAGFIGSHIVDALLANGHEVRVFDNLSTGTRTNVATSAELLIGDIRDYDAVRAAVEGCDLVYHEAALVSVPLSVERPLDNHAINTTGTVNVFEAARCAGVRRVVFASSAAVYGEPETMPIAESAKLNPLSPYALSKLMNEQLAQLYNELYGMEIVGLRYMNVFGPRQRADSPYSGVISIFLDRVRNGQPLTIHGDGEQTRDFIAVADVVRANIHAGTAPFSHAIANVGRGKQTTVKELVEVIQTVVGNQVEVSYGESRAADIRHSCADTRRATEWGFSAETALNAGLSQTYRWLNAQ